MNGWLGDIERVLADRSPAVLVTVAGVRGSAPREVGARMLVTEQQTFGTIGGGQLEYQCAKSAVDALRNRGTTALWRRRFPLGTDCGQCCGGIVEVLFEDVATAEARFALLIEARAAAQPAMLVTSVDADGVIDRRASTDRDDLANAADGIARRVDRPGGFVLYEPIEVSRFDVAVFGAGHVGSATVALLSTLDANLRWIDSRKAAFPEPVPTGVQTLLSGDPPREVAALSPGSYVLVMTHSHPLDYEICSAALARSDLAWIGLIGSRAKRRRFEKRFRAESVSDYERLVCPIGIEGIRGKRPAEIALAVSAQILEDYERGRGRRDRALVLVDGASG